MSKDEALEKWIEAERSRWPRHYDYSSESIEEVAREAWHAAVKHTLAYVAATFINQAGDTETREARYVREWGRLIEKLEP